MTSALSMGKLILIRHSQPVIDPSKPASEWYLSDEGRRRCRALARRLAAYEPYVLVASREPKAIQTAELTAEALGVPFKTAPDLHEHVRGVLPKMSDEDFRAQIAELFARPDELVFGQETATQALVRFTIAVQQVLGEHPANANIGLVTHGTVMSLYVATLEQISPLSFWQRLGLPAFVVIDRTKQVLEKTHFRIVE